MEACGARWLLVWWYSFETNPQDLDDAEHRFEANRRFPALELGNEPIADTSDEREVSLF